MKKEHLLKFIVADIILRAKENGISIDDSTSTSMKKQLLDSMMYMKFIFFSESFNFGYELSSVEFNDIFKTNLKNYIEERYYCSIDDTTFNYVFNDTINDIKTQLTY